MIDAIPSTFLVASSEKALAGALLQERVVDDVSPRELEQLAGPESGPRLARSVLLVDTSSDRLSHLAEVLSPHFFCRTALSPEEAALMMASGKINLVVGHASVCSNKFLESVAAHGLARTCVFLATPDELHRLVDAYAAQHTFRVLSSDPATEDFRAFVHGLVYPREAARRSVPGIRAELAQRDGRTIHCPLLDLSNRGLAIRLGAEQELLLPGTHVADLTLFREDEVILAGVGATVRYIETIAPGDAAAVAYKIGLELSKPPPSVRPESDAVVTESARVLALLQEGLRRSTLTVRDPDTGSLVTVGRPASLILDSTELRIEDDAPLDLSRGDVVEGRFDLAGASYSFLASITRVDLPPESPGYSIRLPRALRAVRQRRSVRVRPRKEHPVMVDLVSPFTGRAAPRPAVNITGSGVAFTLDGGEDLLPIGTHIPLLSLGFSDGTTLSCAASVRTLVPSGEPHRLICGVEFMGLSSTDRARLADAIVHAGRPELRDGTGTRVDDLWDFFLDTRFIYPAKLASMNVDAVKETLSRVLSRPNDVMKTSLVVQGDRIQGHLSGILAYRRTWLMQHLAARVAGKSTMTRGRMLNLAVIEYLEQLPHIEWIKLWYRPNNPWPARVFGAFARKLPDPALSHLRTYGYMVSPAVHSEPPRLGSPAPTVRPAESADLALIESYFVSKRETVPLRADDLTSQDLSLKSVGAAYSALGLSRSRVALVAERRGIFVGFALLEISSVGLNLSELTNSFRVFVTEPDIEAQASLISAARAHYAALGYERCIGLSTEADTHAFSSCGFEQTRQYSCWTWHRSQYQALFEHILKLRV